MKWHHFACFRWLNNGYILAEPKPDYKEVYRNTHYEQGRLHCFQQPARPFGVWCKQEHATQTFPKSLCLCLVLFQSPAATSTAGPAPLALLAHPQNLLFQFQVLFLPFLWDVYIILVTHACRSDLLRNYFVPKTQCWLQVKTYLYFSNFTMSTSRF